MFFDNYLSTPVIGTQDSISQFSTDELRRFHSQFCSRENAIVSICSNLSRKESKRLLNKYFGPSNGRVRNQYKFEDPSYSDKSYMEITKGGIEHSYVWMGMPSVNVGSDIDGAVQVLMTIMGRGMDCRLFTEVREKRGLVYSVSSSNTDWQHGGVSLIEFSTREENLPSAIEIVDDQIDLIKMEKPTEEEVQRAKNKMRSSFYSAIEDSYSLAYWAVKRRLLNVPTIEEYMKKIDAVTPSSVTDAANQIFDQDKMLILLCKGDTDG